MAAKMGFPTRPCPGCGKPIHPRSKTHPECGWTAPATTSSAAKSSATANGKPKSKIDAVRLALAEVGNDAKPLEIQEHVKKKFRITLDPSVISNYKRIILARTGTTGALPVVVVVTSPVKAVPTATISLDDIRTVKELAERLGADKLRELAEVLLK